MSVGLDELPEQVVQRGTEVMDHVTKDQRQPVEGRFSLYSQMIDKPPRLFIMLTNDLEGFSDRELLPHGIEVTDVLLGPLYL